METSSNDYLQPTSVSVLMINAQGMMLSVLGQDYFYHITVCRGYAMRV